MNDHYAVLRVRHDASPQEIEAAYRRVALERGYEYDGWRELQDAYDVLRDPEQRARYDLGLDGAGPPRRCVPPIIASGGHRMLEPGTPAPDFEVQDHTGQTRRLSDFRGKNVVLWFYPKADTPG